MPLHLDSLDKLSDLLKTYLLQKHTTQPQFEKMLLELLPLMRSPSLEKATEERLPGSMGMMTASYLAMNQFASCRKD